MLQRGRKSKASLSIIDTQSLRLSPPDYLNEIEAKIFREIVNACDPRHFRRGEVPLLAQYCTATALSRYYAKHIGDEPKFFRQWESAAKLCAVLSTKLRLAPSARLRAERVERLEYAPPGEPPWSNEEVS